MIARRIPAAWGSSRQWVELRPELVMPTRHPGGFGTALGSTDFGTTRSRPSVASSSWTKGVRAAQPGDAAGIIGCVKPIRTDFKGYEGKYVATDTRTGQVVIADEDLKVVLEKARKLEHVVVGGRVPYADEPLYVGLG